MPKNALIDGRLAGHVPFQKRFKGIADIHTSRPSFHFARLVEYFILGKRWYRAPLMRNGHSKPLDKFIFTFCQLCVVHVTISFPLAAPR